LGRLITVVEYTLRNGRLDDRIKAISLNECTDYLRVESHDNFLRGPRNPFPQNDRIDAYLHLLSKVPLCKHFTSPAIPLSGRSTTQGGRPESTSGPPNQQSIKPLHP
jgi:hypothetical protein